MRPVVRAAGVAAAPFTRAWDRATGTRGLTLIGWHRIGDADDGLTTTLADFRRHLDLLEAWGATVLPLREAHRLLAEGRLPDRAVALTFDDGYASVLEQAWPELQARAWPATLFTVSGMLRAGSRLPWDELHRPGSDLVRLGTADEIRTAAAQGLDIGSHTVTHRWLPALSPAQIADELTRSRADLEDLIGQEVRSFAYPMGGWSRDIRDQVVAAGYDLAITCDRGRNSQRQHAAELRRAFAFDRASDVRLQLDNAFTWMRLIENRRYQREPQW